MPAALPGERGITHTDRAPRVAFCRRPGLCARDGGENRYYEIYNIPHCVDPAKLEGASSARKDIIVAESPICGENPRGS